MDEEPQYDPRKNKIATGIVELIEILFTSRNLNIRERDSRLIITRI